MTDIYLNAKRYRLNVGTVVFNREGKVWLGRRADGKGAQIWQFPQGGVDGKEDLLAAARRELQEETGIRSASLLARAQGWITYDFPAGFAGSKAIKGFAGQTQAWFAFRFDGEDSEIDLNAHHQVEFDAWRWADISEAPDLVVPFKREAYLKVVAAFSPLAQKLAAGEIMPETPRGTILMIHGLGCTGRVWDRMATDFRTRGWAVETPTLRADLRVTANPLPALSTLTLADYAAEAEGWARNIEASTGSAPVLFGHSMGGLIVQKLLERGVGRAGVLVTPAPPEGATTPPAFSVIFAFANILLTPKLENRSHKVWRTGIDWGMLNCVPKSRHAAIRADMVYESGRAIRGLASPETDPDRISVIDESRITVPILTIAAVRDRATLLAGVKATGAKYVRIGGEYREYPDNAHWIIDEPGTDLVVSDIDTWLGATVG